MAQNLYARTAARGFPVQDIAGQTGTGALKDVTRLPERAGVADYSWADYEARQHANYEAAVQAPPDEGWILGDYEWGLPGEKNPDTTPHGVEYEDRTPGDEGPGQQGVRMAMKATANDPYPQGPYHDAPLIDPGLAAMEPFLGAGTGRAEAYAQSDETRRGDIDTSEEVLYSNYPNWGDEYGGFQGKQAVDHVGPYEAPDQVLQERVAGQMRANANAGLDSVQGYGGGGKGPGGVNLPELTYDQRNYPGTFYAHDAFTQVGEVPHVDAETAQFIQNQPGQAMWTGDMWSAPLTQTRAQQVVPPDVPLQGPPVGSGVVYAQVQGDIYDSGLLPLFGD